MHVIMPHWRIVHEKRKHICGTFNNIIKDQYTALTRWLLLWCDAVSGKFITVIVYLMNKVSIYLREAHNIHHIYGPKYSSDSLTCTIDSNHRYFVNIPNVPIHVSLYQGHIAY